MNQKMRNKHKEKMKEDVQERKVFEMTDEEKEAPITKEMGDSCRHRLEKRWYHRQVALNILMVVVVIWGCVYYFFADTKNIKIDDTPLYVELLGYGVAILVLGFVGLYYNYALYCSNSLRITERNFPEIYEIIEKYANRLGMKTPKAYVMQSNGILNAFATFLFRRQWIVIHSEIFEVAYREYKDIDALSFIIAHEMAHIYYGHATLHYNLLIWFAAHVPVFSSIASRTREYSCDRLAQRLTGTDGLDAMLMLVVDRHIYKMVDKEDYLEEMKQQNGFFIWAVNFMASHPVMSKRMIALAKGHGSGELY